MLAWSIKIISHLKAHNAVAIPIIFKPKTGQQKEIRTNGPSTNFGYKQSHYARCRTINLCEQIGRGVWVDLGSSRILELCPAPTTRWDEMVTQCTSECATPSGISPGTIYNCPKSDRSLPTLSPEKFPKIILVTVFGWLKGSRSNISIALSGSRAHHLWRQ